MVFINKIQVHETEKMGRGVFATENIKKGEVIEVAPIIILEFEELVDTKWNNLFNYYFWLDDYVILALGYGSIYNHKDEASASYEINKEDQTITYTATKDIKKGEEIFFNYRGTTKGKTPLWFERK